jgi:hypothetical protein
VPGVWLQGSALFVWMGLILRQTDDHFLNNA